MAERKKTVDLVVPVFNEGLSLRLFFAEARRVAGELPDYRFRIIFVDDGSSDDSLKIISGLAASAPDMPAGGTDGADNGPARGDVPTDAAGIGVDYISFSRNFGKEAAIYAGLRHSTGDYAAVIDADLQHPPAMLCDMLRAVDGGGYDSCSARRVSRKGEPRIRSFFARSFYRLINRMSDVEIVDGAVDFRMMSRRMVSAVLELTEAQRFSKGIFAWVGFKTKWIEFHNVERIAGETKWSFWKLFKYAVEGITSFTTVPLRFATFVGMAISLLSFVLLLYELIKTLIFGVGVPGYPSTLIMLLLIGGIMILSCGILGEYIARMYMETKRRPVYIEKESSFKNTD